MTQQQDLFPGEGLRHAARPGGENLRDLLALSEVRGLGEASVTALYDAFPRLSDVWKASDEELLRVLAGARNPAPSKALDAIRSTTHCDKGERLFSVLRERGISLVERGTAAYPETLLDLEHPPRWLFVEGDPSLLHRRSTAAVVGTRKASEAGSETAGSVATFLVERGWVVLSGLADGIDAAAHRAALEVGGEAIAVLGTGILLDFPSSTVHLRRTIAESGGVVVSEYLPNSRYSRQTFVQRNRIQAALSSIVIPVEGAERSGTAHTLRFAREIGRQLVGVFRGPGEPSETNEILAMVRAAGGPVMDLSTRHDRQELMRLLGRLGEDAEPSSERSELIMRRAYGPALRMLWKSLQARPPEDQSIEWLMKTVRELIARAVEEREDD
jgi:DNA protecting protein DprA